MTELSVVVPVFVPVPVTDTPDEGLSETTEGIPLDQAWVNIPEPPVVDCVKTVEVSGDGEAPHIDKSPVKSGTKAGTTIAEKVVEAEQPALSVTVNVITSVPAVAPGVMVANCLSIDTLNVCPKLVNDPVLE